MLELSTASLHSSEPAASATLSVVSHSSPFTGFHLPPKRRIENSIWAVHYLRKWIAAHDIDVHGAPFIRALEWFGQKKPQLVENRDNYRFRLSSKASDKQYHIEGSPVGKQFIDRTLGQLYGHEELIAELVEGRYTPELDEKLAAIGIELYDDTVATQCEIEEGLPADERQFVLSLVGMLTASHIAEGLVRWDKYPNLSHQDAFAQLRSFNFKEAGRPITLVPSLDRLIERMRPTFADVAALSPEEALERLKGWIVKPAPDAAFTPVRLSKAELAPARNRGPVLSGSTSWLYRWNYGDLLIKVVNVQMKTAASLLKDIQKGENPSKYKPSQNNPWEGSGLNPKSLYAFDFDFSQFMPEHYVIEDTSAKFDLHNALKKNSFLSIVKELFRPTTTQDDIISMLFAMQRGMGLPLSTIPADLVRRAQQARLKETKKKYPRLIGRKLTAVVPALAAMPADKAQTASPLALLWRAAGRTVIALISVGKMMPLPVNTGYGTPYIFWVPRTDLPETVDLMRLFAACALPFADAAVKLAGDKYRWTAQDIPWLMLITAMTILCRYPNTRRNLMPRGTAPTIADLIHVSDVYFSHIGTSAYENTLAVPLALISLDGRPTLRARRIGGDIRLVPGLTRLENGAEVFVSGETLAEDEARRLELLRTHALRALDVDGDVATVTDDFELDENNFSLFLKETISELRILGFYVTFDDDVYSEIDPKFYLSLDEGRSLQSGGLLSDAALSEFNWEVALGDKKISREELLEILKKAGTIFKMDGRFVFLDPATAQRLRNELEEPTFAKARLDAWTKLRALLAGEYHGVEVRATPELQTRLRSILQVRDVTVPDEITVPLRAYQTRGFAWLVNNLRLGMGGLLADDMGLGKTLQVITALQHLKNAGALKDEKVLVVAPASVLVNWSREIARFAPSLTTAIHHGQQRVLETENRPDVLITSYGLLHRDGKALAELKWHLMVIDEAQAVKNPTTAVSKAARTFPVKQVIALTGTPVENRLSEYWSIMAVVQPGLLGTKAAFDREYAKPIEAGGEGSFSTLKRFQALTAPFILRRVKTDKDIIADLPEKNIINRYTELTPAQAVLYQKCLNEGLSGIRSAGPVAGEDLEDHDGLPSAMQRKGRILALITKLKQCTNSPSLLQKTHVAKPDSGKAAALLELLDECRENERKALIFTQFAEMGERLKVWLEGAGCGTDIPYINGSLSVSERQKMIDRFQSDPDCRVMILTLKAGGVGLNLTAANVVIHYDLWWNPAAENQATDRAFRIGQTKDVLVYRFISAGTFEERVDKLLEAKRKLANLTVSSGEKWIGDMSDEELEDIFKLTQ